MLVRRSREQCCSRCLETESDLHQKAKDSGQPEIAPGPRGRLVDGRLMQALLSPQLTSTGFFVGREVERMY